MLPGSLLYERRNKDFKQKQKKQTESLAGVTQGLLRATHSCEASHRTCVSDDTSVNLLSFRHTHVSSCLPGFVHSCISSTLAPSYVVQRPSGTVGWKIFQTLISEAQLSGLKNYSKEIAKLLSHGPVCLCRSEELVS